MTHKQGIYYAPHHDQYRGRILDHYRRIKPAFSVVMTENWTPISEVWQAHQHKVCARVWQIDDGGGDAYDRLKRNPQDAAWAMVHRYRQKRAEWYANATINPMPPHKQFYMHAWNEPNAHVSDELIVEGTKHLLRYAMQEQMPFLVCNYSVGCPESWAAWEDSELEQLIIDSGSIVGLHGYWQAEGPMHSWTDETGKLREDYPWLAGRHHKFPLNVPMVISEAGIDGGIFGRDPGKGWGFYNLTEQAYAEQLRQNHNALDSRVIAQCPFTSDYQNEEWRTFDTVPAMDHIERWVAEYKPDDSTVQVHIPHVVVAPVPGLPEDMGPSNPHPPAPTNDAKFERVMRFVFDAEGGFQNDPQDQGNYWNGHLIGTKYGISAASWAHMYDIPNLTIEQARAIFYWEYYNESGADRQAWPLDLLATNAAIWHGVYRGVYFLTECEGKWWLFHHNQQTWLTNLKTAEIYWKPWMRRMADMILFIGDESHRDGLPL